MRIDDIPDYDGASRFTLRFLTPLAFGWISLSGLGLIVAIATRDSFQVLMMVCGGGIVATILGLLGGCLVDYDRLFHLPHQVLKKRIWICIALSVFFPAGCFHFQNDPGISERDLRDYYIKHKPVLNEILRLCKADSNASLNRYKNELPSIEGSPATVAALKAEVAKIPEVEQLGFSREGSELELVLSATTPGFFEWRRRGLFYTERLSEGDKEVPTTKSFDNLDGVDTRYVRTIEGSWRMFHHHFSD